MILLLFLTPHSLHATYSMLITWNDGDANAECCNIVVNVQRRCYI